MVVAKKLEPEVTRTFLDCREMKCPAPILRIAMAARAAGSAPTILEVVVTDDAFPKDVRAWCRTSKATLIRLLEDGPEIRAIIGLGGISHDGPQDRPAEVAARNEEAGGESEVPAQAPSLQPQSGVEPRRRLPLPPRVGVISVPVPAGSMPAPSEPAVAEAASPGGHEEGPPASAAGFVRVNCGDGVRGFAALDEAAERLGGAAGVFEVVGTYSRFPQQIQAWCDGRHGTVQDLSESQSGYRAVVSVPEETRLREEEQILQSLSPSARAEPDAEELDLRGLVSPEPIRRMAAAVTCNPGTRFRVLSNDPRFFGDALAWANATGVSVQSARQDGGVSVLELSMAAVAPAPVVPSKPARIGSQPEPRTSSPASAQSVEDAGPSVPLARVSASELARLGEVAPAPRENRLTILVIRNDFESLMAAMICATTAAAQGMKTSVFFSFWGVNVLRGERPRANEQKRPKGVLQRMMQAMMPKGPSRQKMSKMHMGGAGKGMMQFFMRKNNVMTLEELMDAAVSGGVQFIVCSMSMDIMGIQRRDIMDLPNIEFAGVASFIDLSQRSSASLVF